MNILPLKNLVEIDFSIGLNVFQVDQSNHFEKTMNLILILIVVVVTFVLFFKFIDYHFYSRAKDTKTGKSIQGDSFFSFILDIFKKQSLAKSLLNKHEIFGETFGTFIFGLFHVVVSEPEMAKRAMVDVKIFPKYAEEFKIGGDLAILFSPKNVTQANGDMWKRQRKSKKKKNF